MGFKKKKVYVGKLRGHSITKWTRRGGRGAKNDKNQNSVLIDVEYPLT